MIARADGMSTTIIDPTPILMTSLRQWRCQASGCDKAIYSGEHFVYWLGTGRVSCLGCGCRSETRREVAA